MPKLSAFSTEYSGDVLDDGTFPSAGGSGLNKLSSEARGTEWRGQTWRVQPQMIGQTLTVVPPDPSEEVSR